MTCDPLSICVFILQPTLAASCKVTYILLYILFLSYYILFLSYYTLFLSCNT